MMGSKARSFDPIDGLTLADLVPADHFYRHLERALDLSFVRGLVADCYAAGGRPSIDPVVFFKLQLVMFFEGIRSELPCQASTGFAAQGEANGFECFRKSVGATSRDGRHGVEPLGKDALLAS